MFFYEHHSPQVQLHKSMINLWFGIFLKFPVYSSSIYGEFMVNLWFGNFLKIPQFIGVWGGIAVELGESVCLLMLGYPPLPSNSQGR